MSTLPSPNPKIFRAENSQLYAHQKLVETQAHGQLTSGAWQQAQPGIPNQR
jgi:hypothetical protein